MVQIYRLYLFDNAGQKVEEERQFQAADDTVALRLSEGWRSDRRAELWCSDRRVHSWSKGKRRSLSVGNRVSNRLLS